MESPSSVPAWAYVLVTNSSRICTRKLSTPLPPAPITAGQWHFSRRRLPSMTDFGSPSGTDIDLFISISENCTDTLKQLYDKLFNRLKERGYAPKQPCTCTIDFTTEGNSPRLRSASALVICTKPAPRVGGSVVDFLAGQIACCPRQSQRSRSSQHKIDARD